MIRRYERSSPGELVHLDVKKVGQIPPGGGWRIHGRNSAQARRSKRSNGPNFVSDAFADQLAERRIVHRRTRPYRPQTNGKAERFNRTLADEFLYNFKFRSESERRIRLKRWVHDYNCHRHHTAVGGPPASCANNLTRTDIWVAPMATIAERQQSRSTT